MPTLREIAGYIDALPDGANQDAMVEASSSIVTHDSRRVMPGGIFVAITGARADGNQFVGEAAKRGPPIFRARPRSFGCALPTRDGRWRKSPRWFTTTRRANSRSWGLRARTGR